MCVGIICAHHTVLTDLILKEVGDEEGASQSSDSVPLWPLVSKVRILCKSDVLKTGLIIADLPGTADANSARSAIAKEYMKKAHIVLVVAPVSRAVAESAATGTYFQFAKIIVIKRSFWQNFSGRRWAHKH